MITLQDRPVLRLELTMPESGAWTASGEVDGDQDLDLVLSEISPFVGTVVKSVVYSDRTGFIMIGGGGKLDTICDSRSYRDCALSVPIGDVAFQCGETTDLQDEILNWEVPAWITTALPGSQLLSLLADQMGMKWWISQDGILTFGTRTAEEAIVNFELVDSSLEGGVLIVAPNDDHEFDLVPPTIIDGKTIHTVRYQLADGILRALCHHG